MIKNGRFFVEPDRSKLNFKELFADLASKGAGRPADSSGAPIGPWTPVLLASAISSLDGNEDGIELRAVQTWFQKNDNGISNANIRWLARIYGCEDPEAVSSWQVELNNAKARLSEQRRAKRNQGTSRPLEKAEISIATGKASSVAKDSVPLHKTDGISDKAERLFQGGGPLNLTILMWGHVAMMLFLAFAFGIHKITYNPVPDVAKQVGLISSFNWYIDKLVLVPLLVFAVGNALSDWKDVDRASLISRHSDLDKANGWRQRLSSYSASFIGILVVCVVVVVLLQWYGSYVRPLRANDSGQRVVDWLLIAIERPEVFSVSESIYVSLFANLGSGLAFWCVFSGFLILIAMSRDFKEICFKSARFYDPTTSHQAIAVANRLMHSVFYCAVVALLVSLEIRLIAVYLMTDAENILAWLVGDALSFLGVRDIEWGWFNKTPSGSLTSFFVMFIPCSVFCLCFNQVLKALQQLRGSANGATCVHQLSLESRFRAFRNKAIAWVAIILLLVANFWLLGRFTGFSILLVISIIIAISSMITPYQKRTDEAAASRI